jgi:TniQ
MISTPRLLPDEWAAGYWGRVLLLNGLGETACAGAKAIFLQNFCSNHGIVFEGVDRALAVVSAAAQVPLVQVLTAHTLVPLDGAVSDVVHGNWFGDRYEATRRRLLTVRDDQRPGSLCSECAEEDLNFWGVSYWRRSHQIPGMVWCQKHGCLLRHTVESMGSQLLPHRAETQTLDADKVTLARSSREGVTISRYTEICSELMLRQKPLSRLQVLRAIGAKARESGLQLDGSASGTSLYELAARCLPSAWLSRHVTRDRLNDVAQRFYSIPVGTDYALALAVLYESADDALLALQDPLPPTKSLTGYINKVVDQHAPKIERPSHREISARQRCLKSAIDGIYSGEDVAAAHKRTGCALRVIEAALVECFAGFDRRAVESASVVSM